jgi:16S rRNA A1518/A1519 N6-dimethyltransferase RsmA/KsgA/DIM1 with predicted DNA glycosylase/AP lyase activity
MTMIRDPEGFEREALARIDALRRAQVLEVGCGDGRLTSQLVEWAARVVAIDADSAVVKTAPSHQNLTLAAASAIELPFPAKYFDTALMSWSL